MGDTKPEPSMEDILASIKRIIADDGPATDFRAPSTPDEADAEDHDMDGVLELTEALDPVDPPVAAAAPVQPAPPRAPEVRAAETVSSEAPPAATILSPDAATASREKLAALSALVVKPEDGSDNTLEGLVREMLRPMLKDWLDQRLPVLVEHLVEKEIARITGRSL